MQAVPESRTAIPPSAPRQQAVPEPLLQNLVEMGFDRRKARAALLRNNNNMETAVDWLAEHWDKPDSFFDDPKPVPTSTPSAPAAPAAAVGHSFSEPSQAVKRYSEIFDPVLRAVALVAVGDTRPNKTALESVRLPAMEQDGWKHLASTVKRIWSGERNERALTAHLDENTSFLVHRILQLTQSSRAADGELDFYVKHAIPKDPQIEAATIAPLRPWVARIARAARRQTAQVFGDSMVPPTAEEQQEDEAVSRFVAALDSKGWQLRTPLDMLCAGVRSDSDILECIAPLPNGLPDDNSARLVNAILEEIARTG